MDQLQQLSGPRALRCERCGTEFTCTKSETCWCADESFRLPMPADNSDCLCQECVREMAENNYRHSGMRR